MTQFWFCKNCLVEGSIDFPDLTDLWRVVDGVRRDHIAKSPACAATYGVPGIHLKSPLIGIDDAEYAAFKAEVMARRHI